ncbi:MAG TPA: phosphate ABC transporter substrate-binding protein PstS [Tepidisphaeraceae bacterium]|nr:phosphate ABC transporter substrate-binding protein PstS [Tepidisphaeraceae bacterium]
MLALLKKTALAVAVLGSSVALGQVRLQGAGATFPEPLYKKWVTAYQAKSSQVMIDYQGIGSGGGIKGITEKTVDFAGSDAPLSKSELEALGGADKVVQIPSTAGGIVPAYNLPGITTELKFSGEVLADIYLGKIASWNDAKIKELNPDVNLPATAITPAWRTDGSGTNYVWTNYLATQSEEFKGSVGTGKAVKWPVGQGGKGNPGVAAIVQQTPGAIGYIEQAYADQNKIFYGSVKNKNGQFVKASPAAVSVAGAGAVEMMKGSVIAADIWNQPGDQAYPIASFTYLIVYKDLGNVKSKEQAAALVDFLKWAVHDGQQLSSELDYAPLAAGVQAKVDAAIATISYKGSALAQR